MALKATKNHGASLFTKALLGLNGTPVGSPGQLVATGTVGGDDIGGNIGFPAIVANMPALTPQPDPQMAKMALEAHGSGDSMTPAEVLAELSQKTTRGRAPTQVEQIEVSGPSSGPTHLPWERCSLPPSEE